jgi:hypothetical protein
VLLALGVGLTMSTVIGGIPALASLPFAFIPPAARLIAKCTCDLILVLCAAFTSKGRFVTKQDFEESLAQYCANREASRGGKGSSIRARVHREIDALIPIHTVRVYEPLSVGKMRTEFHRIVAKYRFTLMEDGALYTLQAFVEGNGQGTSESSVELAAIDDDMRGLGEWMDHHRREKIPAANAAGATFFTDHGSSTDQSEMVSWIELTGIDPPTTVPASTTHQTQTQPQTQTQTQLQSQIRRSPESPYYGLKPEEQQAIYEAHAQAYAKEGEEGVDNRQHQRPRPRPRTHISIAELPGTTMTDPWNSGISELQGSEVQTVTAGGSWFLGGRSELQ